MLRMITKMTYVACACLIIASGIEAKANSYLFRLTDTEINEVMNHYYPRGYDREVVLRQMSEPFACENFGDLCREVGQDYAYRMVESTWKMARMRYPIEMILRAAEGDSENFRSRWIEETYPLGVPDKDPFWGEERAASPGSCTGSAFAESGDFRVLHSSIRHNLGVATWGRSKVEHFKRKLNGKWKATKADHLEVEGTVIIKEAGFDPSVFSVSDS